MTTSDQDPICTLMSKWCDLVKGDATGERTFVLLEGDMLAEFEQLKASSCRSVVLVDSSVGYAFAIGHVSAVK